MADTDQTVGGLTAASGQPLVDFNQTMVEAQRQALEGQRRLDARREQLISAMNTRKSRAFDPSLMRLAAGLLAPTKTGGFGESLGYGVAGMAEEQEKEFLRQQQEAKLAYEIEVGAEEQRRKNLANQMGLQFMQQFGQPSMPSGESVQLSNVVTPTAGQPVAPRQSFASRVPQQTIYGMSMVEGLKPAAETLMKLREEERKDKIKVKEGNQEREVSTADYLALESALASGDYDFAKKWYAKHGLPWNYVEEKRPDGTVGARRMTDAELEAAKSKATETEKAKFGKEEPKWIYEIGAYVPMTPSKAAAYEEARGEGKGKEWLQKNFPEIAPSAPSAAAPARGREILPPRPEEQASRTTTAQKKAESDVESRTKFVNKGMSAGDIVQPAQELFKLASDPTYSMAMAVIDAPGIGNVVAKAISEGVKAGDFSIGFPNIRTAVMQLKRDKDGRPLSDEQRQQILDGFQKLLQNSTQIELTYTQLYLDKQGQVTEGERKLVRATGIDKEDSPTVVKAKAEAIIKRGQFDEKAATAFLDWEKKNPGGTLEEFRLKSPEYRELKNGLNSEMNSIYDKYFGRGRARETTSVAPSQPSGVDRNNRWLR